MKKWIFIFFWILISAKDALTQEPKILSLNLNDALTLAEKRNVDMILADERTRQAVARLGQSVSVLLPQATGSVSQMRQTRNLEASGIKLPGTSAVVGPFNSFDARISLTQSLFDPEAIARMRAAAAGKRLSKALREKTRQDVFALVANLFIEAKRAEEKVRVAKAVLKRDREKFLIVSSRRKIGSASQLEFLESRSRLAQSIYQYKTALSDAEEKRLDFLSALGFSASQKIRFADQRLKDFPFSAEETETDLKRHPELEAAEELLRQRKAEHWAELFKWFPKISGLADYGASGGKPSDSESTYAFGLKATMPFFEGGMNFFKWREAKSRFRESEAQKKDTQIRLEAGVINALNQVKNARALIKSKEAEMTLLTHQMRVSRLGYRQGSSSHLDLTEIRALHASVLDDRWEALALYSMAQVNLAHALGKMDYFLESGLPAGERHE